MGMIGAIVGVLLLGSIVFVYVRRRRVPPRSKTLPAAGHAQHTQPVQQEVQNMRDSTALPLATTLPSPSIAEFLADGELKRQKSFMDDGFSNVVPKERPRRQFMDPRANASLQTGQVKPKSPGQRFTVSGGRALLRAFADLGPRSRADKFDASVQFDEPKAATRVRHSSLIKQKSCFNDGFKSDDRERAPTRRGVRKGTALPSAVAFPAPPAAQLTEAQANPNPSPNPNRAQLAKAQARPAELPGCPKPQSQCVPASPAAANSDAAGIGIGAGACVPPLVPAPDAAESTHLKPAVTARTCLGVTMAKELLTVPAAPPGSPRSSPRQGVDVVRI